MTIISNRLQVQDQVFGCYLLMRSFNQGLLGELLEVPNVIPKSLLVGQATIVHTRLKAIQSLLLPRLLLFELMRCHMDDGDFNRILRIPKMTGMTWTV